MSLKVLRLVILMFLVSLAACRPADQPTPEPPTPAPTTAARSLFAAQELSRAQALLAPAVDRYGLQVEGPLLAPDDVGAEVAFGLRHPDEQLLASVYVFEEASRHAQALDQLVAALPPGAQQPLWSSNGGLLLLVALTADADPAALTLIQSELLASLAGAQ